MKKKDVKKKVYLSCRDHTVTGEKFELLYDSEKEMLITSPAPEPEKLSEYYQSSEYISHTDSVSSFKDKVYQQVKKSMLSKKLRWLNEYKPEKGKLLDFGAGTGDFVSAAKKEGWEVEGVEPDEGARKRARKKGIGLRKNIDKIPETKFDVICLWHVLEHLPDIDIKISQFENLLNKNGLLVIAVPNFKSHDAKYYKEYWAAYDVPRHLWHFSQDSIKNIFSNAGFRLISKKPMIFDAFYVSMLSEKYKKGKANPVNAFLVGLKSNFKAKQTSEYSSIAYFLEKTK